MENEHKHLSEEGFRRIMGPLDNAFNGDDVTSVIPDDLIDQVAADCECNFTSFTHPEKRGQASVLSTIRLAGMKAGLTADGDGRERMEAMMDAENYVIVAQIGTHIAMEKALADTVLDLRRRLTNAVELATSGLTVTDEMVQGIMDRPSVAKPYKPTTPGYL